MSALKSPENSLPDASTRPYPSWDVVATTAGTRQGLDAVDNQARKEARIWRELADEPQDENQSASPPMRG